MTRTLLPRSWHATRDELAAGYPCDAYQHEPYAGYVRAIDIDAPRSTVFRWLCQFKVATYSYDRLYLGGMISPQELTPGLEQLAVGQHFLIFELVEFETDRHLTGVALAAARRLYGNITGTYQVSPRAGDRSRLVVRLDAPASGPLTWLRRELLGIGDTIMMRKQLLTIKRLAERSIGR